MIVSIMTKQFILHVAGLRASQPCMMKVRAL